MANFQTYFPVANFDSNNTHLIVRAASCKFIVSLYTLGAACRGRDYFPHKIQFQAIFDLYHTTTSYSTIFSVYTVTVSTIKLYIACTVAKKCKASQKLVL